MPTLMVLDLTRDEPDGVYETVVNLVESQLRKARSLKGKHRGAWNKLSKGYEISLTFGRI